MNPERPNSSKSDLPVAESTQIETTAKTSLKRLRLTLANKFGLRSNPNSPSQTPPPKRTSTNPSTVNKLDPQVYLDTQSNGFASRVVKYHEASEAKTRGIANKTYRRLGDFPIVNLDKREINLNRKQANEPKVSKINIAPPINLVSASARSTIFRTGKNYGDSYSSLGPIGKIGPIESRKPLRAQASQDEQPIVPTSSEYDSGPVPSSLEALTEISRKRIHCDEIDGDSKKKQRNETSQNDYDQVPSTSKRTRERSSPSYCSSSAEMQKKRYKNNDILSSLSSSMIMSTPKRSLLNIDTTTPTKIVHLDRELIKDAANKSIDDNSAAKQRPPESSRVGTSNSDLPSHRPTEQIKPVIKSMSDGYVPKPETSKIPKLTLFNKDYSKASERKRDIIDDNDEYSVSFVIPKSKTSTLFSGNKNRDQKSKLEMMLSFLRGDESKDEVDSVRVSAGNVDKPSDKNDTNKAAVSSTSANLTTNTLVTFSTATTTSVLNVPSDAIKTSTIETPKDNQNKSLNDVSKTVESNVTQSSTITTPIQLPTSSVAATTSTQIESPQTSNTLTTKSPTVTFNFPSAQTSQPQPISSPPTTTSNETTPRLGGFSFSGTPSTFTSPSTIKPTDNTLAPKSGETKLATPFSFGLAKSTGSSTLPPPYTAPTFGAKTETSTPPTQSGNSQTSISQTTTAPVTFNFGSPASNPSALTTSANISFGTPTTSIPSVANPILGTSTPSMFKFGATANTTTSTVPSMTNTSTSANISTPFAFGANTPSTSVPTFGFGNTPVNATTTAAAPLNQSTPALVFGSPANVSKPDTGAFQFGNNSNTNVTTAPMAFGSAAASNTQQTTSIFGAVNTTNANTTTATPSTFSFGANKPATTTKPSIFGTPTTQSAGAFSSPTPAPTFGTNPTNPIFGSITNPAAAAAATATTTTAAGLFGSATPAQNTPIFGSSNTSSTQPKVENAFGMSNPNNSTPVFGSPNPTNTFGSSINPPAFGSTNNVFGSAAATQIGSNTNLFSAPATTTQAKFGSTSGVFTFGQNASQTPATTTAPTGIFGSANTTTNTNSAFVFGHNNSTVPAQSNNIFGSKPVENANTNPALSAPPAFGSTSPAFNFSAKPVFGAQSESKPPAFSFNAPSTAPANVSAFGSAPAAQFGNTNSNGIGTGFSFNAANNTTEAAKPPAFGFGGPATAPAAQSAFSFNAPNPTQNAFQFNAQQQPPANIFSIGPGSGTNTTKTGRPMRTATRRIK